MKCTFQTNVFLRTTSIKVKWNVYKNLDSWDPDWTHWIKLYRRSLKTHISKSSPDASYALSTIGSGMYDRKEMSNSDRRNRGAQVARLAKESTCRGTKNEMKVRDHSPKKLTKNRTDMSKVTKLAVRLFGPDTRPPNWLLPILASYTPPSLENKSLNVLIC